MCRCAVNQSHKIRKYVNIFFFIFSFTIGTFTAVYGQSTTMLVIVSWKKKIREFFLQLIIFFIIAKTIEKEIPWVIKKKSSHCLFNLIISSIISTMNPSTLSIFRKRTFGMRLKGMFYPHLLFVLFTRSSILEWDFYYLIFSLSLA